MPGNKSVDAGPDPIGATLTKIETSQLEAEAYLSLQAYNEALACCDAAYQLTATLHSIESPMPTPEHKRRLGAAIAVQHKITFELRDTMDAVQATKRQRHKAISAYSKL